MRLMTSAERKQIGPVVGIVNNTPELPRSYLACWEGETMYVHVEKLTWPEVDEQFLELDTVWPERTSTWRNPSFGDRNIYLLDKSEPLPEVIYFIVFKKAVHDEG